MATNPNMNFDEEEDEVVPLQRNTNEGESLEAHLCLVGRFLTKRSIRIAIMKDRLAAIWQPGRGVNIRVLDSNLFLFQFYHWRDVEKVSSGGPWHFDGHMLILAKLGVGDVPAQMPLVEVAFWVQVHDVPIGFMTEAVGRVFGNFIGVFMEYDPKNSSDFWKSFMRIRVLVDVRRPLRRGKKINVGGDIIRTVRFKYERLSVFCYLCGLLGHLDNSCDMLFDMENDDGRRGWGPELKVERRNPGDSNQWLRREGAAAATVEVPPVRAGHGGAFQAGGSNNASSNCNNYEERFRNLNVNNDQIMTNVIVSISNNEVINSLSTATRNSHILSPELMRNNEQLMMTNAERESPRSGAERTGPSGMQALTARRPLLMESLGCENVDDDMHDEIRKRKRRDGSSSSGTISKPGLQSTTTGSFLLAGPGSQACQEK